MMQTLSVGRHYRGGLPSEASREIAKKMTSEHITQALCNNNDTEKRRFAAYILRIIQHTVFVVLGIGVVIWLTIYMSKDNPSLYQSIITIILSFAGGTATGWGIGKTRGKSN